MRLIERALEPQYFHLLQPIHKLRLRSRAQTGLSPLARPAIISSAALRCASVILAAGSGGIRSRKAICPRPFHFTHKRLPTLQ